MPLGKTHDLITFALAVPAFLVGYRWLGQPWLPGVFVIGMLFGGLMFGPDLDIRSKQYNRWGLFRFIWWPYQVLIPHRSRWSHGLVLGTAGRLTYFLVIITLAAAAGLILYEKYMSAPISGREFWDAVSAVQATLAGLDRKVLLAGVLGIWWGAATHSLTDWVVTFVRKY